MSISKNKSYLEKITLTTISIITLALFFNANVPVYAIATIPGSPTGLAAVAVSPTQVNLFWTAPASDGGSVITGYKIEYKSGSFYSTLVENTGTVTTYSHTGLTTGTAYTYKISAINSLGTSTASSDVSITPTSDSAAIAPGAPTGLTATAVSPTKIDLSWTAPANNGGYPITGYKIQYRTGSDSYTDLVANTASTTTSFSHNGITAGQLYIYRVYTITSFATSEKSSPEVTVQPKSASASSTPGAPTGLTATAVSSSKIELSWTAPANNGGYPVTGYKIEYKKGIGTYLSLVSNTVNTTTTYSHTGLTTGTAYTYKISAINSIGTSTASAEASATPTTTLQPAAATAPGSTSLTATPVSATQVNLSWTAPSNGGSAITGYKIEVKKGTGSYETLVANTASTSTTYSHTGLTTGTVYYYRVSAINAIGTGTSGDASATPKETTTPILTATTISPTQISLSWTAPSQTYQQRINGYKVEEKIGSDTFKTIIENTGSTTTYLVTGLTTGKSHTYAVSAIFSLGASPRSNDASATPTSTSVPPVGYSTAPQPQTTPKITSNDPDAALKAQQDEIQKKIDQAKEDMKKKSGKGDSAKAIAAREEAKKANEKARQDALAARQKAMADKQASLKAAQNKTADQLVQEKQKTSKQLHDEAVQLRELEKQAKKK